MSDSTEKPVFCAQINAKLNSKVGMGQCVILVVGNMLFHKTICHSLYSKHGHFEFLKTFGPSLLLIGCRLTFPYSTNVSLSTHIHTQYKYVCNELFVKLEENFTVLLNFNVCYKKKH